MRITNKYDLPVPIVEAVGAFIRKPPASQISATELIDPPLIRLLKLKHAEELEEDASERIWALLGLSIHSILAHADTINHLKEERIFAEVNGWTISGQPDLLNHEGILDDYKVTSTYALSGNIKEEWEQQLNIYRWLYESIGFQVNKLRIVAILRDWSKTRSKRESDYPQTPVIVKEVPIWSLEKARRFVEERVRLHQEAVAGRFDPCTNDERWHKDDAWAVMKKGRKRALKLFNNKPDAEEWMKADSKFKSYLEFRLGQDIRCESYCPVRQFCEFKRGTANADLPSRDSSN